MINLKEIIVGMTTYNRRAFVEQTAKSWAALDEKPDLIIFDDCSSEYDENYLRHIFTDASIVRNASNSGRADYAISSLMKMLAQHGRQYCVLLDSDVLFDAEIFYFICKEASSSNGFFSIFNTPSHPVISDLGGWVTKRHVGSLGTVWRSEILKEVVDSVPPSKQYDWDWSKYLVERLGDLYCSKRSFVQHAGFMLGQNSGYLSGDYGSNFGDMRIDDLSFIFEQYILSEKAALRSHLSSFKIKLENQQAIISRQQEAIQKLLELAKHQMQVNDQLLRGGNG